MWTKPAVSVLLLALSACTNQGGDQNPRKVLSEYVSRSFAVKETPDKAKLLELVTGDVKNTIESMDAVAFRSNFVDTKREFKSLKIKDERKLGDGRYSITYELSYVSKAPVSGAAEPSVDHVTNKKHAFFVQKDGKWLISEVKNLKTLIEHQNEISF